MSVPLIFSEEAWQEKRKELGISLSFHNESSGIKSLHIQSSPKTGTGVNENFCRVGSSFAAFQNTGYASIFVKDSMPVTFISQTDQGEIKMEGFIKKSRQTSTWSITWTCGNKCPT